MKMLRGWLAVYVAMSALLSSGLAVGAMSSATPLLASMLAPVSATSSTSGQPSSPALPTALQVLPDVAPAGSQYPHLVVADGRTFMSWLQSDGEQASLWFASWDGERWSAPLRIAAGRDWFVNWADFPAITVLTDGTLAAHWLQKSAPDGYAYDIQLSFSADGGRHWSAPIRPHDDNTNTEHGFVSLLPQPGNQLSMIWLDGRDSLQHHERMQLRHARFDASGKKLSEQVIDADTCTCCQTSAVNLSALKAGQAGMTQPDAGQTDVLVAYRDHAVDEQRDIGFLRLRGEQWSTPKLVHADRWEIPGCPVNGPALAQAQGQAAVVWYTGAQQQPRIQLAFADPGATGFAAPVRLDRGEPMGRVALVMPGPDLAIAGWLERRGERADWLLRTVQRTGNGADPASYRLGAVLPVADLAIARSSGFPRLALQGSHLMLAWTAVSDGKPPQVKTARIAVSQLP